MEMYDKENPSISGRGLSRRHFLSLGFVCAVSTAMPGNALGAMQDFLIPERELSFYNTHTDEKLKSVYWCQGEYLPEALVSINKILRDHRTGDVKPINTDLLDLLYALRLRLNFTDHIHVISGYRSEKTNALLRKKSRGVAKRSLHMSGKAVDIRLPRRNLKELSSTAIKLKGGGVGYYPGPNFIHVDVGSVRYWRG